MVARDGIEPPTPAFFRAAYRSLTKRYEPVFTRRAVVKVPLDILGAKWEAARKISDPTARKAAMQALINNNEATQERVFLGQLRNNSTMLTMSDIKGNPRIRLQVAADGMAKLEFLDEKGKVTYSLPNNEKK